MNMIGTGGYGGSTYDKFADIEWSKTKFNYSFSVDSFKTDFTVDSKNIDFKVDTFEVMFNINTNKIDFKTNIFNILFNSKL